MSDIAFTLERPAATTAAVYSLATEQPLRRKGGNMRKGKGFPFFFFIILVLSAVQGTSVFAGDMELSVKSAVEMGIQRNSDVIIEKYLHKIAIEKILEAKGEFDPVLSSNIEKGEWKVPIAEIFYPKGFYDENAMRGGIGLKGKIFTGATYGIDSFLEKYKTTSQVVTLSPRYTSRVELSLTQPLLKDFGVSVTKTKIRIAETGAKATKFDVKEKVNKITSAVENAYWNLAYAQGKLDLQKEGLELARRLVSDTELKLKAGDRAPIDLAQAKAEQASREENVIAAQNDLKKAEYDLKLLLGAPNSDDIIVPSDRPKEFEKITDFPESLEAARKNRPALQAAIFRVASKKMEEKYANNQRLPRIDLIGKYGNRGLAGDPSTVIGSNGQPVGNDVIGTPFEGRTSIGDSISDLYPGDGYDNWSVALKLEIPLGNREAEGKYRQIVLERKKMETELKSLDETISNELKKGLLDMQTAVKSGEAAGMTVQFWEDGLKFKEMQFRVGEASGYDVLKCQSDLTEAKTRHLKALIDYNKASSIVRAAEGTSLDKYGIEFNEKI
jgi:outer membrane protein TolC